MAELFSPLKGSLLDPVSAGYLAEVCSHLIVYNAEEVVKFLFVSNVYSEALVKQVGNRSISECLGRLLRADCGGSQFAIEKMRVIDLLVDSISENASCAVVLNAGKVLIDLIDNGKDLRGWNIYMAALIQSQCALKLVLNLTSKQQEKAIISAELIGKILDLEEFDEIYDFPFRSIHRPASHQALSEVYDIFALLNDQMEQITAALSNSTGEIRRIMALIHLLSVVLQSPTPQIERSLVGRRTLGAVVSLFAVYPWASFIHLAIYRLIAALLSSSSSGLKYDLLVTMKFASSLADISRTGELNKAERPGNLAYITLIGNLLLETSDKQPFVAGCLEQDEEWRVFCETTLTRRNELEQGKLGEKQIDEEGNGSQPSTDVSSGSTQEEPDEHAATNTDPSQLFSSFLYWSVPIPPFSSPLPLD